MSWSGRSFGKTTTARALSAAFGLGAYWKLEANARTALAQRICRIRPGHTYAVIEVGVNGPGQMAPQAWALCPDLAVVTCIGSEHGTSFGTLAATRQEKLQMVRALRPSGVAVLNGDDPNVRWMATQTQRRVVTFGVGADNDVRASGIRLDWPHGSRFTLHVAGRRYPVRIRLMGWTMVYPMLAAIAATQVEGIPMQNVLPALERLEPTPRRLEPMAMACGGYVLNDGCKAARETYVAALELLAEIPARRRIAVLGHVTEPLGPAGPLYRRIGRLAGRAATTVIFVGTSKLFRTVRVGAVQAGLAREAVLHAGRNLQKALELLPADLGEGDVVLLKGDISQRLDRIALALTGRSVQCNVSTCRMWMMRCDSCPMLERGGHAAPP